MNVSHGDYMNYAGIGVKAAKNEPELLAHLIAWNHKNGQVRDSKVALPVTAIRGEYDQELIENAIAHLCLLSPRDFMKAVKFHKSLGGLVKLNTFHLWLDKQTSRKDVVGSLANKFVGINYTDRPGDFRKWNKFLSDNNASENDFKHLVIAIREYRQSGFGYKHNTDGHRVDNNTGRLLKDAAVRYVRAREQHRGWWNSTALTHRKSFKEIYKYFHIKPAKFANDILFKNVIPKGSIFEDMKNLKNMSPQQAAGTLLKHKPPFIVVKSAVGNLKDKPDMVLALIEIMSRAELITNTQWLSKLGAFEKPELKAAYDAALERTKDDKKASTMKTTRAAAAVTDEKVKKKLQNVQEEDMRKLAGLEGNWLICGDISGSMWQSIEASRVISGFLAKNGKGETHLIFFDTSPRYFDVTGKSYEEVIQMTKRVSPGGATCIGICMDYALQKGLLVNGIVIISDGGENNSPWFHTAYKKYCAKMGIDPTVYLFHVPGDSNRMAVNCKANDVMVTQYELGSNPDYYALPNILMKLRTSRYALLDEILETPLLTLDEVFKDAA